MKIIKDSKAEFTVPNKSEKLKEEIKNIAAHKGIPYGTFLRSEIIKIRDSYPLAMRMPPNPY